MTNSVMPAIFLFVKHIGEEAGRNDDCVVKDLEAGVPDGDITPGNDD
jgi:hypothetical protein